MTNIIAAVIAAILTVETGGEADPANAVGDSGRAVGAFQVHEIAVREANRLEGIEARREGRKARVWTYSDRYDPVKSREMAEVTLRWHYRRGVTCPVELGARWNRPDGSARQGYKDRIRQALSQ
jgi:hypothetical protein